MQAYPNYNPNSQLDYSAEQLKLPLDLSIKIEETDPMWSFLEVIREVDLNKYLKKHKGNQGHNDRMMMKTVLFAYMNQVYSLRQMEEKCRTDIRFIYLSEEEIQAALPRWEKNGTVRNTVGTVTLEQIAEMLRKEF